MEGQVQVKFSQCFTCFHLVNKNPTSLFARMSLQLSKLPGKEFSRPLINPTQGKGLLYSEQTQDAEYTEISGLAMHRSD